MRTLGKVVLIGFAVSFFGIKYMIDEGGKIQAAESANPTCVSNFKLCKDNDELINRHTGKDGIKLSVICEQAAKKAATYGEPKLPWLAFGRYFEGEGYITSGRGVLLEPDAQFQNGFGAFQHVTARCEYDLAEDVATVEVVPQ